MSENNHYKYDNEIFDQYWGDQLKYNKIKDRVKSFENPLWTKYFIETIYCAKAGFYFLEAPDKLKCYSCKIILDDWNITDDPWAEHAFWSPECKHLKDKKGDEYISEINRQWRRNFLL